MDLILILSPAHMAQFVMEATLGNARTAPRILKLKPNIVSLPSLSRNKISSLIFIQPLFKNTCITLCHHSYQVSATGKTKENYGEWHLKGHQRLRETSCKYIKWPGILGKNICLLVGGVTNCWSLSSDVLQPRGGLQNSEVTEDGQQVLEMTDTFVKCKHALSYSYLLPFCIISQFHIVIKATLLVWGEREYSPQASHAKMLQKEKTA